MSRGVEDALVTGSPSRASGEVELGLEPPPQGSGPPGPGPSLGVWELAWPSMAMFGLHSLVGVVDFVFVSSLGTQAIAAVGVAHQLHFFVFAALGAVTTGTVAVVAREWGAGRHDEVGRVTRASVLLTGGFAFLLMGLGPFAAPVMGWLGAEPAVTRLGAECLWLLLLFNVPLAAEVALSMALRAAGDVRTPLLVGIVANALNVVLDYAFVFGRLGAPELGALGSALATGLSFTFGAVLLFALWVRGSLVLPRGAWRGALTVQRGLRLTRIGLPTALEQGAFQVGLLLFLAIVADFGTAAISAYLIGVRILALSFVPGLGFATAASTLVGQHLGADAPDAASHSGWRANRGAIAVMGTLGLSIVLAAGPLARIFGAAGSETIDLAITFIYVLGAAQPLMAVEFAMGGALRGAGDTRFPLYAILTGLFVCRLGAAWWIVVPLGGGVVAVWCCLLADYSARAGLLAWRFASGRWRQVEV
ncbi:MAG: MATE family efflux transporter [Myxococcota bacterium]